MTEAEGFQGLHSTLVANCAVNAFLSLTAIVLNVITIQALRKTASLSKTLKTLLLSLAVSDLGVGLLAQPIYIATLVIKIDQSTLFGCSVQFTSRILRLLGYVFLPASFFRIFTPFCFFLVSLLPFVIRYLSVNYSTPLRPTPALSTLPFKLTREGFQRM